jgi:hypothetical protein
MFFTGGALLTYGYVRYGPVWLLFRHVRRGDLPKAERLLGTIKNPGRLAAEQQAYYYLSKGMIEENRRDPDAAESSYLRALEVGLRATNDAAVANWRLADIYYRKKMVDEAKARIVRVSALPHEQGIDVEIEKLKAAIEAAWPKPDKGMHPPAAQLGTHPLA